MQDVSGSLLIRRAKIEPIPPSRLNSLATEKDVFGTSMSQYSETENPESSKDFFHHLQQSSFGLLLDFFVCWRNRVYGSLKIYDNLDTV